MTRQESFVPHHVRTPRCCQRHRCSISAGTNGTQTSRLWLIRSCSSLACLQSSLHPGLEPAVIKLGHKLLDNNQRRHNRNHKATSPRHFPLLSLQPPLPAPNPSVRGESVSSKSICHFAGTQQREANISLRLAKSGIWAI